MGGMGPTEDSARATITRASNGVIRAPGAFLTDALGARAVGTGSDAFPYVFDNGVFIDKSMLVRDVLQGFQVNLFCRPRRFGKTLAATMLKDFFECAPLADPAARSRFERLSIWEADGGKWREHQGRYPVFMVSLRNTGSNNWEKTFARIAEVVSEECARHRYVLDSAGLAPNDRARFERLMAGEGSEVDLEVSLGMATRLLADYHGQPCMLIVDEYDAPIIGAHEYGFYQDAVMFMRNWLSGGFKTNLSLARGVLTGVQRISKESVFSGLNNIRVNTPLNQASEERFGFTRAEVAALASYMGHADRIDEIDAWYDGYRFGTVDVYNPWSVLSYLSSGCSAQPYWVNTSGNSVLGEVMRESDPATVEDLLSLLEPGATVECCVDPNIAYGEVFSNPDAVWSVLYMSGYLTTDDTQLPETASEIRRLRIPNSEVREVFRREVTDRARAAVRGPRRLRDLHLALIHADVNSVSRELSSIAMGSVSCYDVTSEAECHMLLLGLLFDMPGYRDPVSNREAGYGRFDLLVVPQGENGAELPLLSVEVKFMPAADYDRAGDEGPAKLAELAHEALDQIDVKSYDAPSPLLPPLPSRVRWGIAFGGKHVAVDVAQA